MYRKPSDVFDRDREWRDLTALVDRARSGVTLGVVYGRRRQGKSWLLRRLVRAANGTYHQALEETRTPALTRIGAVLAGERGLAGGSIALRDWTEAFRALLSPHVGERRTGSRVIVLDEVPFLLSHSPELPSALQAVIDDSRGGRGTRAALLLCGSALSVMGSLLEGSRPLRGRATMELVLGGFDYRQARTFWRVRNLDVALALHAILGGTPGYRDILPPAPPTLHALGDWLAAGVLDPAHALFRETEYLLTEDPRVTDTSLYHAVLDALSRGECTPSRIAARLGRAEGALRHPLRLLEGAELLRRNDDALRERHPVLEVADPIVRFQHLIARPRTALLEERQARQAWIDAAPTFASAILGPHFEHLAREWTRRFASATTVGGAITEVGQTTVSDPPNRTQIQLDVIALARESGAGRPVVRVIGEAKARKRPCSTADLARLERARALLSNSSRAVANGAKLALFSRTGFDPGPAHEFSCASAENAESRTWSA